MSETNDDPTTPERSRSDEVIHEPDSSTVEDWFGQNVARDQEVADQAAREHADPDRAEAAFERRAVGEERYEQGHPRPGRSDDRPQPPWDERLDGGTDDSLSAMLSQPVLGYPLHPMLNDLPIGFWTSSWFLDLFGGKEAHGAADRLVGLGILSAIPAAITGLATRERLDPDRKQLATIHGYANAATLGLYGLSWMLRRRGSRGAGVAIAQVAAVSATIGAHLGGRIAFGDAPDHHDGRPDAAGPPTGPVAQR